MCEVVFTPDIEKLSWFSINKCSMSGLILFESFLVDNMIIGSMILSFCASKFFRIWFFLGLIAKFMKVQLVVK